MASAVQVYSMHQMRKLLEEAEAYCNGDMVPCTWLYRNKEKEYFDNILQTNRGIMEPIMKDESGDPRNPINGRLEGVFFTASVKKGSDSKPLETSPYGSSRFQVPLEYLIDSDCYNLYFADFYCAGTNIHYVVLVVAEVNSKADHFCGDNLPLLDWDYNEFLTCDGNDDHFEITSTKSCIVELFYAKVVNVRRALKMGGAQLRNDIPSFGRRQELYKNLNCSTCNFCITQKVEPLLTPGKAYSMHQMNTILYKAVEYCDGDMVPCKWLYRNKPLEYFFEIFLHKKGIMKPVMKDRGGDPRNPINNKLEAVFFTASVKRGSTDGEPLKRSPYGSSRFQASIDYLIDPDNFNLYFADFYCSGSDFHYISLVVAEVDSEADDVCGDCLPMLNWDYNAFLTCDDENHFEVTDSDFCIVEVLYAKEVNVILAFIEGKAIAKNELPTHGRALLMDGGLDKNLECSICNNFKPSWGRHLKQFDPSDASCSGEEVDSDSEYRQNLHLSGGCSSTMS